MPTPLDRAMSSRSAFLGFVGIVTAVAAWGIWNGDMFPPEQDPVGDPENWEDTDIRRWLNFRGLLPDTKATREQLIERVKANMRATPKTK